MRDFATRRDWLREKRPPRERHYLRWVIAGIVILVILSAIVSHQRKAQKAAAPKVVAAAAPVKQTMQFDFYHMLTESKDVTPVKTAAPPKVMSVATPDSGYYLSLGHFNSLDAAEQLRANLILSGLSTELLHIQQQNNTYHVQLGPYPNQELALSAQKNLAGQHMKAVMLARKE